MKSGIRTTEDDPWTKNLVNIEVKEIRNSYTDRDMSFVKLEPNYKH